MSYNSTEQNQVVTPVSIASSGQNSLVAAATAQRVYVFSGVFVAAATVTIKLQDGNTDLTGAITLVAGVPLNLQPRPDGKPLFTTTLGNALNATLGGAVQVSGWINTVQA